MSIICLLFGINETEPRAYSVMFTLRVWKKNVFLSINLFKAFDKSGFVKTHMERIIYADTYMWEEIILSISVFTKPDLSKAI